PRDPLLPVLPIQRPLSPLEKRALGETLDGVNQQAIAAYEAGEVDEAFELWMRELQLRRTISRLAELEAMERVAAYVWAANRAEEAQLITFRLQQIEADLQTAGPIALDDLYTLGQVYRTLREQTAAVAVYENIAARQAELGDRDAQIDAVEQVAQLYLDGFYHSQAAAAYQRLLRLSDEIATVEQRNRYLEQLIYSHEEAQQFESAIAAQGLLLDLYQRQGLNDSLPLLALSIARNYLALNRPDLAKPYYESAYANAQILIQHDNASETLLDLASIYRELEDFEQTLELYSILVEVGRQSDDLYTMMNAFDQIGQIYRDLDQSEFAKLAFERGLTIAQRLSHQETYFEAQLRSLDAPETLPEALPETPGLGQPWRSGRNTENP
ncbi:MAG: hypothetical protein AAF651_01960, partial [Cyanobacteria bacterium P01_C01_bin.73]